MALMCQARNELLQVGGVTAHATTPCSASCSPRAGARLAQAEVPPLADRREAALGAEVAGVS
eukprot:5146684-Pyramimonas_sp.AAC.1